MVLAVRGLGAEDGIEAFTNVVLQACLQAVML